MKINGQFLTNSTPESGRKKSSSAPKEKNGVAGNSNDQYKDKVEISKNTNESLKQVDRQDQIYSKFQKNSSDESGQVSENLASTGSVEDEKIAKIRAQIAEGNYDSIVVNRSVADLILMELKK